MNNDNSQLQYSQYSSPYSMCNPGPPLQSVNPATPISPIANPATPLSPTIPSTPMPPIYPPMQQGPPPVTLADYIPGYLASVIGRNIKAEFIVGASQYVEKSGRLIDVGVNYFVLQDINSHTNIMCDLYSVKFVTVLYL
jgi:hypothetical protein